MTYDEAIKRINGYQAHGAAPGLSRIRALLEKLGDPQADLLFLHVAGTNGKGSTATMLASVLQEAGYRIGLYTSPYIYDFRERFLINGAMIGKEELARLAARVLNGADELDLPFTAFEIITAIGFLYFKEARCGIVVAEVGLGGRFDATNVIQKPLASVICSISQDHMEYLGSTVAEIAAEKAGIIKQGCPVILYPANPSDAVGVIRARCAALQAPLVIGGAPENAVGNEQGNRFCYRGLAFQTRLCGAHQINNAITAIETLLYLRERHVLQFTDRDLQNGIARAYIPARLDRIHSDPPVFTDGGHNREGIDALAAAIDEIPLLQEPVIIFGMLKDKPYQYALQKLALRARAVVCLAPNSPRAMDAHDLANIAGVYCSDCTAASSPGEAVRLALEKRGGRAIIVAGSLYLAGDVARAFKKVL